MNDDLLSFGAWLQARRAALGFTQRELGGRAGCSAATIRKIEADERRPSPEVAAALAEQLGLSAAQQAMFVRVARRELALELLGAPDALAQPAAPLLLSAAAPSALTPLIGRASALEQLQQLLRAPGVRLLTLVGPAGVGKTRLATALCEALQPAFADGVLYLPLAPLRAPEQVQAALAQALHINETGPSSLAARIRQTLAGRQLLLVLDNFEHLLEAGPLVSELLGMAPHLKVLATSRTRLRLSGEHLFHVAPLPAPAPGQPLGDLAALARIPAVELLLQRVQALEPAFALTPASAPLVAAVCARLDGLPLAIELAAARVPQLGLELVARQLDAALHLLTDGPRDAPERQQSLRAALDWSYALLRPAEQELLDWMGVFVGGCCQETALLVAQLLRGEIADPRAPLHPSPTLANLGALIDGSLVRRQPRTDQPDRLVLLETVREYACERLAARDDAGAVALAHLRCYLALAERIAPELQGAQQAAAQARIAEDEPNIRAALLYAIRAGHTELALRLCRAMAYYWWLGWDRGKVLVWFAQSLALAGYPIDPAPVLSDAPGPLDPLVASVIYWYARLMDYQTDEQVCRGCDFQQIALGYARRCGAEAQIAACLMSLGFLKARLRHYDSAEDYYRQAFERFQRLGDLHGQANAIQHWGLLAKDHQRYEQAEDLMLRGLELARRVNNSWAVGMALLKLGWLARQRNLDEQAIDYLTAGHKVLPMISSSDIGCDILSLLISLQIKRDASGALAAWTAEWHTFLGQQTSCSQNGTGCDWALLLRRHRDSSQAVPILLEEGLWFFSDERDIPLSFQATLLLERQAILTGQEIQARLLRQQRIKMLDKPIDALVKARLLTSGQELDALERLRRGDRSGARQLLLQARHQSVQQGWRAMQLQVDLRLAWLALAEGDRPGATARLAAALEGLRELAGRRLVAYALLGVAALAAGQPPQAATLYRSATQLLADLKLDDPFWAWPEVRQSSAELAAQLADWTEAAEPLRTRATAVAAGLELLALQSAPAGRDQHLGQVA